MTDSMRHPILENVGQRIRNLRAIRGMTRKQLAHSASISERHLANLESGSGNASLVLLSQVSQALRVSTVDLLGDVTGSSPEWLLIRELLQGRDEVTLQKIRMHLGEFLGNDMPSGQRHSRIALIGLRGAGKSTLGKLLADHLGWPFVEVTRELEKLAGCSIGEIQALYGGDAYRRYERKALQDIIRAHDEVVIATPGGLPTDGAMLSMVLEHCTTIWLKASAQDHMERVMAQGDLRPIAASGEAMTDLKSILAGRESFYAKADHTLDTSAQGLEATFTELKKIIP